MRFKVLSLSVSSLWSLIDGGISTPKGFLASGVKAGLKASKNFDLALLVAPEGAICAGMFTQSFARANCIDLAIERLKKTAGKTRAILINSGQANACTGDRGLIDSLCASKALADLLAVEEEEVLICSTGVIGTPIKMNNLLNGLPSLVASLSDNGSDNAAQAILTTDLVAKQIALESNIDGRRVQIGGMAKGSGMIHPDMATMLGYITCDASVPLDVWKGIVKRAVNRSFNTITVDGDTSTNDAFLGFAAGQPLQSQFWNHLEEGVNIAAENLAKAIARDGEGATCLIEVEVMGSLTNAEATKIARTICGSSLVKTAIHGNDPNWGRIVAAAGRSGVKIDIHELCLWIGPYQLLKNGEPLKFDKSKVSSFINDRKKGSYLINDNVQIRLTIGSGRSLGKAWGCDLSNQYIHINADYTT